MNLFNYRFVHQLIHLPFVDEIWLYGSRARDDNTLKSDIDLAINCPQATEEEWQQLREIINGADTLYSIDCIRFDRLEEGDVLRKNILMFKKVIFQRKEGYMSKEFWRDYFESLGKALDRLQELMEHPQLDEFDYFCDATVQRFEFCIELYWKVLKKFLAYEKIVAVTPREVLSKAYQYGFIDDEKIWLLMLDDRNKTSHLYREEEAKKIFKHIKSYWPVMKKTYESLKKKF